LRLSLQLSDAFWCSDGDDMDWQSMIDLESDDTIDHEISHLVWIVKIDDSDDVRSNRIIATRTNLEDYAGIPGLDQALKLADRLFNR
jgi:hypothetical protein